MPSTMLVGRLATSEDPRDVYRVFVPAHSHFTVKTTAAAGVELGLWRRTTTSVTERAPRKDRLARSAAKGLW